MEHESPAQRQKSSQRVCLVVRCLSWKGVPDEFKFYIVDWDSSTGSGSGSGGGGGGGDEYTDMEPTFRFKSKGTSPPLVAFCALKSTLYMFEGDDHNRRRRRNREGWFAGKFVISEDIVSCYNLKKKDLLRINQMNEKKFSPIALPTPNGKSVLVFSSEIILNPPEGYFGDSFELYNVEDDSWQLLPRLPSDLPQPLPPSIYLSIIAYGFETESRFLMSIDTGIFVLDLNKPSTWEQSEWGDTWLREGHFLGIDGFYFSPGWACDTRDHGLQFEYPPLPPSPIDYDSIPTHLRRHGTLFPYISLLGHKDNRVYDIGVVKAYCHPDHMEGPKNVRVILDISRTVIEKFKKDIGIYKMEIEEYQRVLDDYEFKKNCKMYKSLTEDYDDEDYKEHGEYDDEDYDDEDEEEEPDDEAEGEEPDDEAEGEEPDDEAEGEEPDDEAEGEEPDDEAEGEEPYPVFNSSVLDTNRTLRNTTDFIKSIKLRIDVDYDSYGCGRMYLFSI